MKRGRFAGQLLVAVMCLAVLCFIGTGAVGATSQENFEYELINEGEKVEITGYTGAGGDLTIPAEIEGKPVVKVGGFSESELTSVIMPDSVIELGHSAFNYNELESVTISKNITSISDFAFANNQLATVTIPESVVSVGRYAFANNNLTEITIPTGVTSIGEVAFIGNQLSKAIVPASVTEIGTYAFGEYPESPEDLTIYGETGSAAQEYAEANNHTFALISERPEDEWHPWPHQTTSDTRKPWTISFSKAYKSELVTADTVYITKSDGTTKIPVSYDHGETELKVVPENDYTLGETYKLWIQDLESADGTPLKQKVYMDFTITDEPDPANRVIDSIAVEIREGSIEYAYTFKDEDLVVTWDSAISEDYRLDQVASHVALLRNGTRLGDEVSLQELGIESAASADESGKTTFTDFMSMVERFGIIIDMEDPASADNIPTHVEVFVTSEAGAENPWDKTITEAIPADMIPEIPDPDIPDNTSFNVAKSLSEFQYHNELVGRYYDEGVAEMGRVDLNTNTASGLIRTLAALQYGPLLQNIPVEAIPQEFMDTLPPDGSIPAPPGACPAAADPRVTFVTAAGDEITPQLMSGIEIIPANMIMAAADDPNSLVKKMEGLIDMTDQTLMQQLANPAGWNTHLWDKLKAERQPAASLMDYQMWNVSAEIEAQAAAQYLQNLQAAPIPDEFKDDIIAAFNNSAKTGWFASTQPTPADAFARMDIVAEMTGNISGTVYETREFSIPGAGQLPVYGTQTGHGTVNFEHPDLGSMTFDVEIELDQFDEYGRAIAGEVRATETEHGYSSRFIFDKDDDENPIKKGELLLNGELVGTLTMTVDAEHFENYIDFETGEEMSLPHPQN